MLRMTTAVENSFLRTTIFGLFVAGTAGSLSCSAPKSNEDLNPEGAPMIRQVMATERVIVNDSPRVLEGQLVFGSHPAEYFEGDDGMVNSAIALGAQEVRIILDELILGNSLEEIACADGTFSRIPQGTTPDDVTRCAGPVDSIQKCTKVCIGADGTPIGILDANDDGAADDFRMIDYNDDPNVTELGVGIECDGVPVPLDQEFSFWTPSGNQTFPSNDTLGYRGLGPALVLKPQATVGLRTGSLCNVTFRPEVTDADGNRVCAPAGGIPAEGCADGDLSAVSFSTEPLALATSVPSDGDTDVSLSASAFILLAFNANIDVATVSGVTLTADGADVTMIPEVQEDDTTSVVIMLQDDFLPETEYVLTVATSVTDLLGGSAPDELTVSWTTEAAPAPPAP